MDRVEINLITSILGFSFEENDFFAIRAISANLPY